VAPQHYAPLIPPARCPAPADASFRDLTRPAVLKDAGVIIEPIRFSKAMAQYDEQVGARVCMCVWWGGGFKVAGGTPQAGQPYAQQRGGAFCSPTPGDPCQHSAILPLGVAGRQEARACDHYCGRDAQEKQEAGVAARLEGRLSPPLWH
jgi:hypothetical protein